MTLFNTQEAEIAGIIVEHLGVEAKDVTREASFENDLGADSLDMVELTMAFEDHFNIEISDDEAEKVKTVDDAFKAIAVATDHEADATIRPVQHG